MTFFSLAIGGTAFANNFGMRYWTTAEYGNISSISLPSNTQQPANSYAMYLHRSVIQSSFSGNPGLIQAGWATVGSHISLDNCGSTNSSTFAFVETKPVNGGYTCTFYGRYTYPTIFNFNVFVNSSGWNDKINGVLDPNGPYALNGMPNGYGMVGGESLVLAGTAQATTCFGEGASQWNYYSSPSNGGAGSILVSPNSLTTTVLSGGWRIDSAPSPLCDSIP
jgi:hypothetical protein